MAGNAGEPPREPFEPSTRGLRPLGLPRPVRVRAGERGEPLEVTVPPRGAAAGGEQRFAVEAVEEVWRIAEEWWREAPLARTYYRVIVDGGRSLTLFHDDLAGVDGVDGASGAGGAPGVGWYEQRY